MRLCQIFALMGLWVLQSCTQESPQRFVLETGNPELKMDRGFLLWGEKVFTGDIVEKFVDGKLKSRTRYQNGKRSGIVETWYPSGEKDAIRFYQNGEKEGTHEAWWPNGQRRFRYLFKNGETEGDQWEWYSNGSPATHFQFSKGHEVGPQMAWRENGKLYINLVITNGRRYGLFNSKLCFTVKDGEAQIGKSE